MVLAPGSHPLVGERNISLQRLVQEPFIMREPGSGTRIAVERLFRKHKLDLKVRMEIGSNEAIKQAIVGGLGISVLSRHTLALDAAMGRIVTLDVNHFPIERQWYVAYPTGKQLSIVAQTFFEYLRGAADRINDIPCYFAEQAGSCPLLESTPVEAAAASRQANKSRA